jgi:hypothetical protein
MNFGSFRIQKPYFKHIYLIKQKSGGLSARSQGLGGFYSRETGGFFNKNAKRKGIEFPRPLDLGSMTEIRNDGRACGTRGVWVADWWTREVSGSGLASGD